MAPHAVPHCFGAAERPMFGWLHVPPADVPPRSIGLVICKPFGYESICAHRSLRHFGDAAAAMGVTALRFDYDGTGDSAGDDRDPQRLKAWLSSVHQAIGELRRVTGVGGVCLLGVRFGATLATLAASERDDVRALAAIAPVLSGKAWLRELNALEIAMRFDPPPPGLELRAGESESVGFPIVEETKLALQGVDLLTMTRPPAASVLILDRDDLAPNPKWADRLSALGVTVDHRRLPGYAEMMLDPHESVVPTGMVEALRGWLSERAPVAAGTIAALPNATSRIALMRVAPDVEETAGYLSPTTNLFGVVSAPTHVARPARAILLLNSGAIPHIGPSRLYVQLARRWASRGYLVLRFDQAGIGDSAPFPGESENVVYAPSAVRGVEAAMTHLRDVWGVTEFQALGLCSGAYHALKAAAAGLPLKAVAIVNPLVFFWKPGMSLAYPPYKMSEASARYRQSFLQLEKWKKLLSGKVDVAAFAHVMLHQLVQRTGTFWRNVWRAVGRPRRDDLGAELETVANRGVALRFVFATGDPGENLLRSQAGWSLRSLQRDQRLRIQRIKGPNHAFTAGWTRTVLTEVLETELELR